MAAPVASIIIPAYNHARYLPDAIESALAQTVRCEVLVIDDGSTDDTRDVTRRFGAHIRVESIPHTGPGAARNQGLERAAAPYVMFLDADDVLAPSKVEEQLAAFDDTVDWVICDVRIEDEARGRIVTASQQYGYAQKNLGGWIQTLLAEANFIPIMAPLVRRSLLGDDIRFSDDLVPEDWYFWQAVAAAGRVRYLPRVLAIYRHRTTGRSRTKPSRSAAVALAPPLRLNLGCGTPHTRSWHPIPGFVNLDKSLGWRFEDGLDFADRTVAGITISHALMYVAEQDWPRVCAELARVLKPGGVVRITEDETQDPRSSRVGGWQGSQPAVTLTSPAFVRRYLERAGFTVYDVTRSTTHFADRSLCQAQHGEPPDVFFLEGVRDAGVLFAPHHDDEALFAAFTILRYRPTVVVCFPSAGDYGDTAVRVAESREAVRELGGAGVESWDGTDLTTRMRAFDLEHRPARVWAPDRRTSHPDHLAVSAAASAVFGDRLATYHTYDAQGKVRAGRLVDFEPAWLERKQQALNWYTSQIHHPRARQFFAWDLAEYAGQART